MTTTEAKLTTQGKAFGLKEGVPLPQSEGLQFEFPGGCLDLTRHLIDGDVLTTLFEHAEAKQLCATRDAMFAGARINASEDRAVLHVALRGGVQHAIKVDGEDPVAYATEQLDRMLAFADAIRNGQIEASSGVPFTDVINIGIGGSDLGPRMAVEALRSSASGPRVHFVANVDGHDFELVTRELNPKTTLCLVASKTFTTLETMMNARTARAWIAEAVGEDNVGAHFAALSTNAEAVQAFGIHPDRMFGFRDWVGGRFSMWSPIGLSLACAIGSEGFRALLAGAAAMDRHFAEAPVGQNAPMLLGLLGYWCRVHLGFAGHAVIPYDRRLGRLPAYLQQADMESNGKRVSASGEPLTGPTGALVFGEPGTDAQHAFFQWLHQGTDRALVDLIGVIHPDHDHDEHHRALLANLVAQAEALRHGRTPEAARAAAVEAGLQGDALELATASMTFPGDRPVTVLLLDRLDAYCLGSLVALHEHRIFVEGVLYGLNSFDQPGVELGKTLAKTILPQLSGNASEMDPRLGWLLQQCQNGLAKT